MAVWTVTTRVSVCGCSRATRRSDGGRCSLTAHRSGGRPRASTSSHHRLGSPPAGGTRRRRPLGWRCLLPEVDVDDLHAAASSVAGPAAWARLRRCAVASCSGSGSRGGGFRRPASPACWHASPAITATTPATLDDLVADLLDQQLTDGGWNCATRTDREKHGSFHTSIQALEALHAYAGAGGGIDVGQALHRGQEFFLRHHLYRSHRSDAVAVRGSTRFPAFPEWHFDVLRGLEHFADTDAPRDERLADAVGVLYRARRKDGRWRTYAPHPGRQWFNLEPAGPSRWNTCRVLRVLRWWEQ